MSAKEPGAELGRQRASHTVAGFLAGIAIFAGLTALVRYPGRIGVAAIFISLLAAALAGPHQRRFTGLAAVVATGGWLFGMIIAVFLDRPIF